MYMLPGARGVCIVSLTGLQSSSINTNTTSRIGCQHSLCIGSYCVHCKLGQPRTRQLSNSVSFISSTLRDTLPMPPSRATAASPRPDRRSAHIPSPPLSSWPPSPHSTDRLAAPAAPFAAGLRLCFDTCESWCECITEIGCHRPFRARAPPPPAKGRLSGSPSESDRPPAAVR